MHPELLFVLKMGMGKMEKMGASFVPFLKNKNRINFFNRSGSITTREPPTKTPRLSLAIFQTNGISDR